ncbi:hypothetical protein M758_3G178300 [Ceratodon purpureus]|nr:hypothetical protein M758_3G178300 [Ceratodon purpureus]
MKEGDSDMTGGPPLGPIRPVRSTEHRAPRAGKRKRRERQPNWETTETFALVKAKRAEHDEFSVLNGDLIRWCNGERGGDSANKWARIAEVLWNEGASVVFRNAESCKDKWGQLNGEYKKIRDYEKTRVVNGNRASYWDLPAAERQLFHLPKTFHSRTLYNRMDEFLNDCPPPLNSRPTVVMQNAALRLLSGDHAAGARSHPSETPANIRELCVPAVASRSHPGPEVTAPVTPNGVRLVESLPAVGRCSGPTPQPQKHVGGTEVAAAIRDRLARLRERICASEAGSQDTERMCASEAGSPETQGTENGATKLEGKHYKCIQAVIVGDGTVGLVTLDRPEALNALSHALMLELVDALQTFDASTQVGAMVVTGKGEAFSAGVDIKEMRDKTNFVDAYASRFAHHWNAVTAIRKPIIAAMNGYAVGGGSELAMMCDIILAGEGAQFGQPEINLGTIPGMGGSQRLIREVGKSRAMEMILTGKHFMNAHEAAQRGLVSCVVPGDNETLVAEAVSLAREISQKSKPVVALAKEIVNTAYEMGLTKGVKMEQLMFHATFGLEDQKEGMTAFLERRGPVFKDK